MLGDVSGTTGTTPPLEQRRRPADQAPSKRHDARHIHHHNGVHTRGSHLELDREEDRSFRNSTRTALTEQRRAYAGMTNVEARGTEHVAMQGTQSRMSTMSAGRSAILEMAIAVRMKQPRLVACWRLDLRPRT